ncbi:MAG: ParB N-terminal domain-containing protein, partial [Rhizomicrobium sp.]
MMSQDKEKKETTVVNGAQPNNYRQVALSKIINPPGRRLAGPDEVADLAESIKEVGQLEPIGLTADYHLIYGGRRKAACEFLKHDSIDAIILDLDNLHVELAEIDENVERKALTVLDESQALARRKIIYETLHP